MSLIQDMQPYLEPTWKCASPYVNPTDHSCDNAHLFNAIYVALLKQDSDYSAQEWLRTADNIERFMDACLSNGYLKRYPNDTTDEQHDDYRAVAYLSKAMTNPGFCARLLELGRTNDYCWNSQKPGTFDINFKFDRFPGFLAQMEAGAGESVDIINQLSFFASCLATPKRDGSETQLQWLATKTLEGRHLLTDLGIYWWRQRAMKVWPGGLKEVFSEYYNKHHPFYQYARKDFE